MPLILAIEPDRRQASQLTALVRGRLKADLVIGESADRALAALGERVPDLVLTAALLSPKDEAALGQRLRELNGVAAHVQTLTIPVLASSRGRGDRASGGLLSALRRDKPKVATLEGCDPAVFAEQCKEYLERAASERELNAEHAQETYDDPPVDAAEPIERNAAAVDVASFEASAAADTRVPFAESVGVADVSSVVMAAAPSVQAMIAQPTFSKPTFSDSAFVEPAVTEAAFAAPASVTPAFVETPHVDEIATRATVAEEPSLDSARDGGERVEPPVVKPTRRRARKAQPLADPLDMTDGPASLVAALAMFEAGEEPTREEPAAAEPQFLDVARVDAPVAVMPLETATHQAVEEPVEERAEDTVDETTDGDVADMDLSSLLDESAGGHRRDDRQPDEDAVEVYDIDDSYLQSPTVTLDAAADEGAPEMVEETEHPQEWVDIIEALRRDAEQMPIRKSRADASKTTAAAPVKASEPPADAAVKAKRQRPGAPPAQDEWGFFDPDQCGFAALLEKLQEITEDDRPPRRPPSA